MILKLPKKVPMPPPPPPRECTFCKHSYRNPCDGDDERCTNKLYIELTVTTDKQEGADDA